MAATDSDCYDRVVAGGGAVGLFGAITCGELRRQEAASFAGGLWKGRGEGSFYGAGVIYSHGLYADALSNMLP